MSETGQERARRREGLGALLDTEDGWVWSCAEKFDFGRELKWNARERIPFSASSALSACICVCERERGGGRGGGRERSWGGYRLNSICVCFFVVYVNGFVCF